MILTRVSNNKKKLNLNTTQSLRKRLKAISVFENKDEILKVFGKCKSYASSTSPLEFTDKTNHPIADKFLQKFIDLVIYEDSRIKEIKYNKNTIIFVAKSHYFVDENFYTLFSTEPLIYNPKNKRGS